MFLFVGKAGRVRPERLTAKSACELVNGYASRIGLDAEAYGAHLLRSGFPTSAARSRRLDLQDAGRFATQVARRAAGVRARRRHIPRPCRGGVVVTSQVVDTRRPLQLSW